MHDVTRYRIQKIKSPPNFQRQVHFYYDHFSNPIFAGIILSKQTINIQHLSHMSEIALVPNLVKLSSKNEREKWLLRYMKKPTNYIYLWKVMYTNINTRRMLENYQDTNTKILLIFTGRGNLSKFLLGCFWNQLYLHQVHERKNVSSFL